MSTARQTHDHQAIKDWALERDAIPVIDKGTADDPDPGLLRIHFPGKSPTNANFKEIEWDDFFENFEERNLDLILQDKKESGEVSTFHKFVKRG